MHTSLFVHGEHQLERNQAIAEPWKKKKQQTSYSEELQREAEKV